jgi:protein TonB
MSKIQRSAAERRKIWIFQNRFRIFGVVSVFVQLAAIYGVEFEPLRFEDGDRVFDQIAFVSNLQVESEAGETEVAEGEIEPTDKKLEEQLDDRIASAVDPFQVRATPPVDLSPSDKPEYTAEARAAGFEGKLYIEIVVADTGEVLMVRPRNQVGYGLEQIAVRTYRRKRFQPAIMQGKPITVKIIVPVRYSLK